MRADRHGPGRIRTRAVYAATTVAFAIGLAAMAAGQEPDVPTLDERSDAPGTAIDTEITPRARGASSWKQVAGARYPHATLVAGSSTSFDVDLYAVSMRNTKLGFAGGAKCRVETAPEDIASCDAVTGNPAVGARVPVIYRFRQLRSGDRVWEPMRLGSGSDEPGYVGAISWLNADTAVAVGGTGAYPRREPDCVTGVAGCLDPAGAGRAWIYRAGEWSELDLSAQRAQGMGGLTAVSFNPEVDLARGIAGVAGGLGQLWEWDEGTFARRIDRHSSNEDIQNRHLFRYRVRQIERRYSATSSTTDHGYTAVTSGCCGPTPAHNVPRVLVHTRPSGAARSRWVVESEGLDDADPERECSARWPVGPASGVDSRALVCGTSEEHGLDQPLEEHSETIDTARSLGTNIDPRLAGDSFYAVTGGDSISARVIAVVVSPGGKEVDGERPSQIVTRAQASLGIGRPPPLPSAGTARLADADDDSAGSQARTSPHTPAPAGPDGVPDWAVGETRAARSALGRRGLFTATHLRPPLRPDTVSDPTPLATNPDGVSDYEPTDEQRLDRHLSATLFESTSYSLNAIDMVELDGEATGQGWAVGDRGAIVGLNEGDAVPPDPPAPVLGTRDEGRLPDDSGYATPLGAPAEPGIVPPLAEQEMVVDGEWRARPVAALEAAHRIVMSRTGDEGWALGSTRGHFGVSHFDGARWNLCGQSDGPGATPDLDQACVGAQALFDGAPGSEPVAAARVPFEADGDPANDDEFEVVALVSGVPSSVMRYRDGRWRREQDLPSGGGPGAVAFARPDDGWALWGRPGNDNFVGDNNYQFLHYDGSAWKSCYRKVGNTGHDDCDPHNRLPQRAGHGSVIELVGVPGRVYAIGQRLQGMSTPVPSLDSSTRLTRAQQPMIIYREPGAPWAKEPRAGEYDPGLSQDAQLQQLDNAGIIDSLAVVRRPDGAYEGWATGVFGARLAHDLGRVAQQNPYGHARPPAAPLLRLAPGVAEWRRATVAESGAFRDYARGFDTRTYFGGEIPTAKTLSSQIALAAGDGTTSRAFLTQDTGRLFAWNVEQREWQMLPTGRPHFNGWNSRPAGSGTALASDGRGGFFSLASSHMFHYTDRQPREVFRDVAQPALPPGRRIRALAATPDGTVWAATSSDVVYRYRRQTGWDGVRVPGWDPGGVVTVPSEANAIAVGEADEGVVVGDGGRIARIEPGGVRLDDAAGTVCDLAAPAPPCGTSRDLLSVAVAPGGSAIAGGERLSLLWRPAGGQFRAVARPEAAAAAAISAVAMPAPDRAWLGTSSGLVFAGTMNAPGEWSWELENVDSNGDAIAAGAVSAIAIDTDGHGYAAGSSGLLEREAGAWRPIELEPASIALPPDGSAGALIGDFGGGIRTLIDGEFEVARAREFGGAAGSGAVSALALAPGLDDGQIEAWAVVDSRPVQRLLHYASDPDETLLTPAGRVEPLPDTPSPRPGDLSFAAFGKTDCHAPEGGRCYEMAGVTEHSEEMAARIVAEVARRSKLAGGPIAAVSTGGSADVAGYVGEQAAESTVHGTSSAPHPHNAHTVSAYGPTKLRRWSEFVAERLERAGVPVFGVPGAGDTSAATCSGGGCETMRRSATAGDNLAWRQAMATRPAPWGDAPPAAAQGFRFAPLDGGQGSSRLEDIEVAEPDDGGVPRNAAAVPVGGASTHYALDLVSEATDRATARLVFLDSSFGSLSQSDPLQQPVVGGGQLGWLERMVCTVGSLPGVPCTRRPDQPAIVVSNTPTYAYFPGLGLQATPADGAALEEILLRHRATAMVSGRLGWNGLYWATAPGLHYPCTGERYTATPPDRVGSCRSGELDDDAARAVLDDSKGLAESLRPAAAPLPPDPDVQGGLLPVVVSSGAGGKFGIPGAATAGDGFWHGFSIVRVSPDGDPRKTIVEQRPIYEWVSIEAQERKLRPGQRMTLRGFARPPIANGSGGGPGPGQLHRIDSDAVTHRYDLVRADPERPWLPLEDAIGDYVPVDSRVATINGETGVVRAGRGLGARTYAIGILSVGELAASYPLAFEPRRSFTAQRARVTLPPLPRAARAPAAQPPVRLAETPPPPPSAPPATPGAPLSAQTLQPPQPPALPTLPAAQSPPIPSAPAPPSFAPPPPPPAPAPTAPQQQAQPLALGAKLQAVAIVPSVNPPAPPPVNPAPPGGSAARKEAKQRQAATAKSEEGGGADGAAAGEEATRVNPGTDPSHGSSRLGSGEHAFTRLDRESATSAATRGVLYGGGLGAAALLLALAWRAAPTTRRSRELPAPARATPRRH